MLDSASSAVWRAAALTSNGIGFVVVWSPNFSLNVPPVATCCRRCTSGPAWMPSSTVMTCTRPSPTIWPLISVWSVIVVSPSKLSMRVSTSATVASWASSMRPLPSLSMPSESSAAFDGLASMKTSKPSPPVTVSLPRPLSSTSLNGVPMSWSLPVPPMRTSAI